MNGVQRHLVLFARAPRLGVGKRRLARDVGRLQAWRFYRANLQALIRRLQGGPWTLTLAVAQSQDADHPAFVGLSVMVQPPGDLGARMSGVLRHMPPGPAIIIGSDIPGIQRVHIQQAFEGLGTAEAVFGPALDGGYWLVGLARRRPVPYMFMKNVPWSTSEALKATCATLPHDYRVKLVNRLADIDDGVSYQTYLKAGGSAR
ncbi:MAG: glycosyltransferase [Alphaproteobacteria bacterium]|nr:glycosyltransferase [Alphaproteobacteria bacterium]